MIWYRCFDHEVVFGEWVLDTEFGGVEVEAFFTFFAIPVVTVFFIANYGAAFIG